MPESHIVLVTNDGSELTHQLISVLEERNNQVVILNLRSINMLMNTRSVTLSNNDDESVGNAIQEIQEKYGRIGCVIHLHPHFEFQPPHFTQCFSEEREIIKTLFFIAKHVQKDLNDLGIDQRASFITCTRMDGQLGHGKRNNTSVVGGGIAGLVKCLNIEWSPVYCRAIDIQPELSSKQIIHQLMAEYHDPDVSVVEVGFSEEGRKTTTVTPTDVQENKTISTTISSDSVFLVSGGARGVTASCMLEMAKTFQCKFVLLGRSAINFSMPEFAKNEHDETRLKSLIMNDMKERNEKPSLPKVRRVFKEIIAKKEIDKTISEIESYGSQVIYIQGDVTDLSSFRIHLDQATKQLGNVTGVIHGAGRLADKYIQDKTMNDFENVLSVKLDGLLSLLSAVKIDQLDHLILFSSVAGFYGNIGQTDYAIANEILSKTAYLFKTNHPKTQVSAINWGAWDSGMVSGELKTQFEAAGISLVNSEGGAAMLVNELNIEYSNQPQVIIGSTLPLATSHLGDLKTHRIHRKLSIENNRFINHHKIQNNPVLPIVNGVGWMTQSCEDLYPDYSLFKIENISLFKGIIFDGNQKDNYILELKELEKNKEKIVFDSIIYSKGKRLPINHYRATITLLNNKSSIEQPYFNHQINANYQTTAGHILYEDGTLFHAPYFQGIHEILDFTEQQIVLSCIAQEVPLSEQGQFPVNSLNTFFADIQYQGMLVWVQKYFDGAKSLPLRTDRAILYRKIPFGKKLFVTIKVRESNELTLVADCTVYDEQGLIYIETQGAAVTISRQLVW